MEENTMLIPAELLPTPPMPLGPGRPNERLRPVLTALTPSILFVGQPVRDPAMASCCLAALWLVHDFLEESHALSQEIATPEGSCWHGILHRREPDFANAKYWFRRVGKHAVFEALHREVAAERASVPQAAQSLSRGTTWDASAFVDLCEQAAGQGGELEAFCRRWQQREWELLFEHCWGAH
jgi:hypothetical protein